VFGYCFSLLEKSNYPYFSVVGCWKYEVTNYVVDCVYKVTFVVVGIVERTSRPKLCME
jgi:hypothetical protein